MRVSILPQSLHFLFLLTTLFLHPTTCSNITEQGTAIKALQQLDEAFKNVNMEHVKTEMDALTESFNDNFMKVFGMNPDLIADDVVDMQDTLIPANLRGSGLVRKNPGVVFSVSKDVIKKNLKLALPKILEAIGLTPLPYLFRIANVLVRNVIPTITSPDEEWMDIDMDPLTNSIIITVTNMRMSLDMDIGVVLLMVPDLKGTLNAKLKINKLVLRVYLVADKEHYYFKPRIYMTFTEIDIDHQNVTFLLDLDLVPNALGAFIPILFTDKIMPTITYYLQASTHDHTTRQMNAVIQNYFSDNIVLLKDKLAVCALLTDKIKVERNRLVASFNGELFNPSLEYHISHNPDRIDFSTAPQQNVQLAVAQHILKTFFQSYFSVASNSLVPVKIMSKFCICRYTYIYIYVYICFGRFEIKILNPKYLLTPLTKLFSPQHPL